MEEKFDTEFKRKVKGINPEIPDVVRMRISDTLASLPEKRNWRKSGYLSAVAALFLVCFVGIRYIYPMQLSKDAAPESARNSKIAAADSTENQSVQENNFTMEDNTADDKALEGNTGGTPSVSLKVSVAPSANGSITATVGTTSDTSNTEISLTGNDGKTAADQGIQLILKTAIYDGKEIRIEFDKSLANKKVATAGVKQVYGTTTSNSSNDVLRSAQVNVLENYDVRIVVNNIPLKCSINVIETAQGENQYSGTMIIVPDSGLPENLDIILNFDKIGDVSGQWLLTTQVSKQ